MSGARELPLGRGRAREEVLSGFVEEFEEAEAGLEGYDSAQRAEILSATTQGPTDGAIQIAPVPDRG